MVFHCIVLHFVVDADKHKSVTDIFTEYSHSVFIFEHKPISSNVALATKPLLFDTRDYIIKVKFILKDVV